MRKCPEGAGGDVEMLHLPAPAPKLNPVGVAWREIKAAIANVFLDGPEKMRGAIGWRIRNGEIPTVKMFDWLLAA